MPVNYDRGLSAVTNTTLYRNGAMVLAGAGVSVVLRNLSERTLGIDLPDPLYGAGTMFVAGGMGQRRIALGGAVYGLYGFGQMAGLNSMVTGLGSGGGS